MSSRSLTIAFVEVTRASYARNGLLLSIGPTRSNHISGAYCFADIAGASEKSRLTCGFASASR